MYLCPVKKLKEITAFITTYNKYIDINNGILA